MTSLQYCMLARVLFSRVAAAIVIGMLATVAVAWAAAIGWIWAWDSRKYLVHGVSHKTVPAWTFTQERTAAAVKNQCRPVYEQFKLKRREGANSHVIESWSMMRTPPAPGLLDEESLNTVWFSETVAGWPMLALAMNSVHDFRNFDKPGPIASSLVDADWALVAEVRGKQRVLPLRPMPVGFAINTLVFGSPVWLILTTVALVRRNVRRRRGGCQQCGYTIGTAGGLCPECGTQNRSRNGAPTAAIPPASPPAL